MGLLSVDFDFFHHWEFNVELFGHKLFNFLWRSTFLSEKLVAGESKNFEAQTSPLIVCLDHSFIVVRGESSLTGYIDDHDELFVFETLHVEGFAADIVEFEIKKSLDCGSGEGLAA